MDHPPVPSAFDTPQDRRDAAAFLASARTKIASPDDWAPRCQWALDPDGRAVDAHDPLAVRWSATAALRVASRFASGVSVHLGWTALDYSVGPDFNRFEWAGNTTHADMMQVFDLAIVRLIGDMGPGSDDTDGDALHDGDDVHSLALRVANELLDQAHDASTDLDIAQRRGLLLQAESTQREGARRAGVEPEGPEVLRSNVEALRDRERH